MVVVVEAEGADEEEITHKLYNVSTMSFMLGGKQTVKKPLSVFFN